MRVQLDEALEAAQSVRDGDLADAEMAETIAAISDAPRRYGQRQRTRRRLVGGLSALAMLVVGAPALADQIGVGLHTGDYGPESSGDTGNSGGSTRVEPLKFCGRMRTNTHSRRATVSIR